MKKEIIKLEIESLLLKIKDNQLLQESLPKEEFSHALYNKNNRLQIEVGELLDELKDLENK
jgi:hypothetical protein